MKPKIVKGVPIGERDGKVSPSYLLRTADVGDAIKCSAADINTFRSAAQKQNIHIKSALQSGGWYYVWKLSE